MVYLHGVLGSLCTLKLMLAADELEGKRFSLHFLNITERRGGEEREAESLVSRILFTESFPEFNHTDTHTHPRCVPLFGCFGQINTALVMQINRHVPAIKLALLFMYTPLNRRHCR